MSKGQAERLMPMMVEMLADNDLAWQDIDVIGVQIGPGNFTGVRVGVAAARGLALALDAPSIGVSGFEVAAAGLAGEGWITLSDLRGSGFRQRFRDGVAVSPILPAEVAAQARSQAPCATIVARIALARLGHPIDPPTPLYLRAPDAAPSRQTPPALIDDA